MYSHRLCYSLRRLSHSLSDARLSFVRGELQDLKSLNPVTAAGSGSLPPRPQEPKKEAAAAAELSHRWPEWAELVEVLFKKGYLDPSDLVGPKNSNLIRSACLDFARDRFDLISHSELAQRGCHSSHVEEKVELFLQNKHKKMEVVYSYCDSKYAITQNQSDIYTDKSFPFFLQLSDDVWGGKQSLLYCLRYFSRRDIHIMAAAGCPSLDRKVVNSGKRLRAHVGINEGDVCSSCSLRGSCERAYVKACEDEGGRTVDVMRFLLTYGLDLTTGSLNDQASFSKIVKESVRKLMNEMVQFTDKEFSSSTLQATSGQLPARLGKESSGHQTPRSQTNVLMKQGDWICPKCNFLNFAKNIKCLRCDGVFQERLDRLREEREHLPLKKGDWICEKCNFLNFAKNTRCLQCQEKPTRRQLNPGEWECVSCNYINFRKNMVCLKCGWKRPKASSSGDTPPEPHHDSRRDYPKHSGILFVRDSREASSHHFIQQKCPSGEEEGTNFWSDEDETNGDDDDNDDSSWNISADNFPMLGGKNVITKDPHLRERWKGEMSRSRGISSEGLKENACETDYSAPAGPRFDGSSDDEDIAGWFRRKSGS